MRTTTHKAPVSGYASVLMVLAIGGLLAALSVAAYKRASQAREVQNQVQLRLDYSEKEEAALRAIVALVPNRAIRAMKQGSNSSTKNRDPLRWNNIFDEALATANARTSIPPDLRTKLNIPDLIIANTGDSGLGEVSKMFAAINQSGLVSSGTSTTLGATYPAPLAWTDSSVASSQDALYPLVSWGKGIGSPDRINASLPPRREFLFQTLKYPNISFGYAKPGEDFVAKRNWWAFTIDAGGFDGNTTRLARRKREFVLSIYEIPSQLAISASAFMSLGQFGSGDAWTNVAIGGAVFAGKAMVEGTTSLDSLSARSGVTLSENSKIGGLSSSQSSDPFARENYQITTGKFFPVSLASEAGRAMFVPINREKDYFDRFSAPDESNTISATSWNDYSIGARQCAMRLDITGVKSTTDATPTRYRFSYLLANGVRESEDIPLDGTFVPTLPRGYTRVCAENQSFKFNETVDVAYGERGGYSFRQGISGTVNFNNGTFGDPLYGTVKSGYWRPCIPFENKNTSTDPTAQKCVAVYPERFPGFLSALGVADVSINNSLVVNVDYTVSGLNNSARKPSIPCTPSDYGVILRECADLRAYTRGFSLVTNLRLFIGDDFNVKPYDNGSGDPPCSLFAPQKRYGVDVDPFAVSVTGQVGSLAKGYKVKASDADPTMVRPLDSTAASGTALDAARISVNLKPITKPGDLPPVYMMNWLVVLEERRPEFY